MRKVAPPGTRFAPCEPGTLCEFALESYTGFFCRGSERYVFRAWHPPWLQAPVDVTIQERGLPDTVFPWFKEAKLMGANYAPGFEKVWLGKAHRLAGPPRRRHSAASTFLRCLEHERARSDMD